MGQTPCSMGAPVSDTAAPMPVPECELAPRNVKLGHVMTLEVRNRVLKGHLAPFFAPTDNEKDEECPICCNNFRDFNWFTCCNHPICSECYVQLWQTPHVERTRYTVGVQCPFCKDENGHLHLRFRKLSAQEKAQRRKEEEESREAQRRAQLRDKSDLGCFLAPPTPSPTRHRNTYSPQSPRVGGRVGLPTISPSATTNVRTPYPAHARHPQPLHAAPAPPRTPTWGAASQRSEFPGFPTFAPTFGAIMEQRESSMHVDALIRAPPAPARPAAERHRLHMHAGLDTVEEHELPARVQALRQLNSVLHGIDRVNDYAWEMCSTLQRQRWRQFTGPEAESTLSDSSSTNTPEDTPLASPSALSPMRSDTTMVTSDESPAAITRPRGDSANNVVTSGAAGLSMSGGAVTSSPLQFAYAMSPSEFMRDTHDDDALSIDARAALTQRFLTLARRRNSNPFGISESPENDQDVQDSHMHAPHASGRPNVASSQDSERRRGSVFGSARRELLVPRAGTSREARTSDPDPPARFQQRPTPPLPSQSQASRNAWTFYSRHPQAPMSSPGLGLAHGGSGRTPTPTPTPAAAAAAASSSSSAGSSPTSPTPVKRTPGSSITTSPPNPPSPQTPTAPGLPPLPPRRSPPRSQTHTPVSHARSPPARPPRHTTNGPCAQDTCNATPETTAADSEYISFANLNSRSTHLSPFSLADDAYNSYIGAPSSFYSPPRAGQRYYPPQATWRWEHSSREEPPPYPHNPPSGSSTSTSFSMRNPEAETSWPAALVSSPASLSALQPLDEGIRGFLEALEQADHGDDSSSLGSSVFLDIQEALNQARQLQADLPPAQLSESLISEWRGPNSPPLRGRQSPPSNAHSTPLCPPYPRPPRALAPGYSMHVRAPQSAEPSRRTLDVDAMWIPLPDVDSISDHLHGRSASPRMRSMHSHVDGWEDSWGDDCSDYRSPFPPFRRLPRAETDRISPDAADVPQDISLRQMHAAWGASQVETPSPQQVSTGVHARGPPARNTQNARNARNAQNSRFDHLAPASATEEQAMLEVALELSREGGDGSNTRNASALQSCTMDSLHAVHANGCNDFAANRSTNPRSNEWLQQLQQSTSEPLGPHRSAQVGLPLLEDSGSFQRSLSQVPEHSRQHSSAPLDTFAALLSDETHVRSRSGQVADVLTFLAGERAEGTQNALSLQGSGPDSSSSGTVRQGPRSSPFSSLHWPTWSFGRRIREMSARRGERPGNNNSRSNIMDGQGTLQTGSPPGGVSGMGGRAAMRVAVERSRNEREDAVGNRARAMSRSEHAQRRRRRYELGARERRERWGRRHVWGCEGAAEDADEESGGAARHTRGLLLHRRRRNRMSSPSTAGAVRRLSPPPRSGGARSRGSGAAGAASAAGSRRYSAAAQAWPATRRPAGASRAQLVAYLCEEEEVVPTLQT